MVTPRLLSPAEIAAERETLADALKEAVDGGAGLGFLAPLDSEEARRWWDRAADDVAAGRRAVIAAHVDGGLVGFVHLVFPSLETGRERAEVGKLVVRRAARRRGVGSALLAGAEAEARRRGRRILVLDTFVGSDAEDLYARAGWTRVGIIPTYALRPDGSPGDLVIFYRTLDP